MKDNLRLIVLFSWCVLAGCGGTKIPAGAEPPMCSSGAKLVVTERHEGVRGAEMRTTIVASCVNSVGLMDGMTREYNARTGKILSEKIY